jgi:uncharacterized protein GlcG (DUF336 family)
MKLAALAILAASLAAPAAAQTSGKQPVLVTLKRLSLDTALKAAQAAIEACRKAGVQVAVSVLDRGGDAQVVLRDVLAADLTLKVSHGKAYAALSFVTPTSQLGNRFSTPFAPPSVGAVVIAAGGLPIQAGGELVGGIGVAGAPSGETDERCARAGIDAISEDLELGR